MSFKETFRIYYKLARFTRGPFRSGVFAAVQTFIERRN